LLRAFGLALCVITVSVSKLIRETLEPDSDSVNSSTSRSESISFGLLKTNYHHAARIPRQIQPILSRIHV